MTDLLHVDGLKIAFRTPEGEVEAVRGVSFRIRPGSTVALVGESGSGKSVVSQAIMGILPRPARITGGRILFRDPDQPGPPVDIARLDPDGAELRALRGRRISIIFQEPMTSLSPLHTIGDQVGEAVRLHRGVSRADARRLTAEMLELVGFAHPQRALDTYPFELSGGLRQRAMIAMALICRPALLIADEPTTALDVTIQAQILGLIRDLQAEFGMAVLMISHDLGVVANVAREIVVMYRGQVMESGALADVFGAPRHPYLKALLHAVPRFGMGPDERLQPIRDIRIKGGALLMRHEAPAAKAAARTRPLLAVDGIRKTFMVRRAKGSEPVLAVDDVGFEIRRGECLGLVGESGCGKTTLSKILMRALSADAGSVRFDDRGTEVDVLGLTGRDLAAFRKRIQFIFQDPFSSLNPRMTVLDILTEPLAIHSIGDADFRRAMAAELMGLVGLDHRLMNRYPHSFSGGQRQRIGIARALALSPDLIICDEPTSALDVSIQAQILNLLKDLQERLGLTMLFISHNLAVVDYIAQRIMVMCRGRIVEVAPREVLFRAPSHPYTKALLAAVPDPGRKLDFALLRAGNASDPTAWPAPFTIAGAARPHLVDLGGGHFVRAASAEAACA